MVAKLGGAFLVCAMGPLSFAAGSIMQNRVAEGLGELTSDNLFGGVVRGIAEVARRAGASEEAVRDLIPVAALERAARQVDDDQRQATKAWHLHAGHVGGLLAGIAELTVDGRTPDVGLCLERLAKKLAHDDELAGPLSRLAKQVMRYQDLVEAASDALAEGGALERAYRRRQRRQILRWVGGLVLLAVMMGGVGRWQVARSRVARAVADPDPCAVLELAERDRRLAPQSLLDQARDNQVRCEERRMAAVREREEAEREEAERLATERAREARLAACEALAGRVERGALAPDDREIAGESFAWLERVAARALSPEDLGPDDPPPLPCGDTPAHARLTALLAKALLHDPARWVAAPAPSPTLRRVLLEHRAEIEDRHKILLAERAERLAKEAVTAGLPEGIASAAARCDLARGLGIGGGVSCDAAARLVGSSAPP